MTRDEALPLARSIAAGVCAANGNSDDYCRYMREGAYDDDPTVLAAQAALVVGYRKAELAKTSLSAVQDIAA